MIRQRGDGRLEAKCDVNNCDQYLGSWETLEGLHHGLKENCWGFDVWNRCWCGRHAGQLKKEEPVCIAREGEFTDEPDFCWNISKCPRVKKDDVCPARMHVLWEFRYRILSTGRDAYKIHRTPDFLAACAKCLGEGEKKEEEKGLSPLHIGIPGVEICVQQADEKKCHPSCRFYSPPESVLYPHLCENYDEPCAVGYRCQKCLEEYPSPVVDAEINLGDRVTFLEKRVDALEKRWLNSTVFSKKKEEKK